MLKLDEDMLRVAETIKEARIEAARSREGGKIDLCNILLKVLKEWETKGKDWLFKHYWQANPDPEISNWRNESGVDIDE